MNKTFKIVKNSLGQYVVAGEFAKSKSRSQTATKALLLSALSALSLSSYASIVRDDVDYQEFRNFAENKGKYQVGAVNIPVYDKSGKYLGTALPKDVPMPDFSVANSQTAVATLINTQGYGDRYSSNGEVINSAQYVGTVAHNTNNILSNLTFGDELRKYQPVNYHRVSDIWLNEDIKYYEKLKTAHDFATPKLSKMVTSVAGIDAIPDKHIANVITGDRDVVDIPDLGRVSANTYAAVARLGSGIQYIFDAQNDKPIQKARAYFYVTGGSPILPMWTNYELINANSSQAENYLTASGEVLPILTTQWQKGSSLITMTLSGDSGSPLFAYNKDLSRWELFSFTQGGSTCNQDKSKAADCYTSNTSVEDTISLFDKSYLDKIIDNYQVTRLNNQYGNGGEFDWEDNHDGTSSFRLSNTNNVVEHLNIANRLSNGDDKGAAALDHGRDLYLGDGVTLKLTNYIDQGAGGIYLREGTATVKSAAGQAWVGSGVWVGEGATLNWAVMQPDARELERTDNSPYDVMSKLGKGTLHVQGGEGINMGEISVGEGTVLLDKSPRYEGSDDFAFSKVTLTSGRGTVKLMQNNQVKDDAFAFGFRGGKLDLNGHDIKSSIYSFDDGAHIFNSNEDNPSNWRFSLKRSSGFQGFIGNKDSSTNGKINVEITSGVNGAPFYILNGGANTQGYLNTNRVRLIIQGKDIPYADTLEKDGEENVLVATTTDTDWINRDYAFREINATNRSVISVDRNVSTLSASAINAEDQSTISLGATKTDGYSTLIWGNNITDSDASNDIFYSMLPKTKGTIGIINLSNNSKLNLGKFDLTAAIHADETSPVTLSQDATWNMNADSRVANLTQESNSSLNLLNGRLTAKIATTQGSTAQTKIGANAIWQLLGDSTVGNLNLEQGAKVLLNSENEFNLFNTLTIYDTLSGNGEFVFNTDLANLKGNKVKVLNLKGEHVIDVVNSGEEVSRADLVLFELGSGKQEGTLKLKNGHVDAGAYRYTLSDLVANTFKLQDTTPKPDEPVTPVDPNPVTPVDPNPVTPVDPNPVTPVDPNPVTPVDPNPVTPVDPNPVTPVDPNPVTPVDPNPVTPVDPNPVTPVDPNPVTPVDPNPVTPVDPNPVTPVDPNPVTPVDPNPVTPVDPNPVTPVDPNPVTPVDPNPVTPVDPNPVTPVDPNPVTPVDPNPVTPVDPNPVTPVDPNPVTPVDPNPVTPVDPNPVTPADPNPVTPVDPNPVTPVDPNPVTPVDPNPVMPVDPNPVTPVDPNPVTPVDPNPVTPVDPNPVTPVDPNPVTPVDPNPVTPVDPNPVTPVDPNPVTPVDPNPVTPVDPNPVTPVDPNPVTPVDPNPVTPVDPNPVTPVDPNPVTPVDPNPVTPVDPNPVTPVDPNPVTPVDPNPVTPVDPNPVTPVDPNPVTPVDPNPVTPVDPNPVTPIDPNPVTPVDPNPVTPVDPNPVTPVDPNPVTPVDPNPVTPVDPNPVTPVDPNPVTPVDPNPVTPVNPNPVTPVDTNPVTPVDPNPVTPVEPNPVTPVDPNPVTPVDPNPVTPVDPNPVTPVAPNPVTPVDPNPVTPVDPNPVTPVDPNPVTPVDPNPVTPVAPEPVQPTTPEPVKPQNQVISKYTNAVLSDAIAAEEAVLDAGSGMVQHIGNTTLSYDRQFNVWTGFSAQNADYSSSQYRDFKRQHRQTQLGVDMLAMPNVQMGLALTQAKNTNEFAEARGKNDLLMGNVYAKYLADNGAFIALDVGMGELKNEVTIAEKAKFTRNVVQVGVTAGKAFEFGQFEVKPQAGLRYSRLSSANYRLDGANINVEATKPTTAFVGVETGYKFNLGAMSVKPMISANYAVNKGEHTISVNGNNFTYDSDNQQNYRAGVEVKYRLATFSLNGGITKGNQLGTQRVVNAGLSLSF